MEKRALWRRTGIYNGLIPMRAFTPNGSFQVYQYFNTRYAKRAQDVSWSSASKDSFGKCAIIGFLPRQSIAMAFTEVTR